MWNINRKIQSKLAKKENINGVVVAVAVAVVYELNLLLLYREIWIKKFIILDISSHILSHLEATSASATLWNLFLNIERALARSYSCSPDDAVAAAAAAAAVDVFAHVTVKW